MTYAQRRRRKEWSRDGIQGDATERGKGRKKRTYLRDSQIRLVWLIIIENLTSYFLVDILNIPIGEVV
jgi:hypothetical protein